MSDESSETSTPNTAPQANPTDAGPIVARFGRYYRNTRYLMFLLFFGFGVWSIYHGFYLYPKENAEWDPTHSVKPPHPAFDAPFNKAMGIILPPLGVFILLFARHNSRGEYRLDGETVSIP